MRTTRSGSRAGTLSPSSPLSGSVHPRSVKSIPSWSRSPNRNRGDYFWLRHRQQQPLRDRSLCCREVDMLHVRIGLGPALPSLRWTGAASRFERPQRGRTQIRQAGCPPCDEEAVRVVPQTPTVDEAGVPGSKARLVWLWRGSNAAARDRALNRKSEDPRHAVDERK